MQNISFRFRFLITKNIIHYLAFVLARRFGPLDKKIHPEMTSLETRKSKQVYVNTLCTVLQVSLLPHSSRRQAS
jgi:hypothetical protein